MSAPAMPLPPGGDINRAPTLIGVTWFECAVSIVFVALRFYCRIRITRNVWWDNWVILITLALTTVISAMYTVYAHLGGARHVGYLDPEEISIVAEYNYIVLAPIVVAIAIGKSAVALLIYRLQSPSRWRTGLLWFLSVSSLILAILVCIVEYVQCTPTKALWIPTAGTCWDPKPVNDFDVAASAAICAAVKASMLHTLTAKSDLTWLTTEFLIWNANEVNIIIWCACLPTLQPLFRTFFDKVHSLTGGTIGTFGNSNHQRAGYKLEGSRNDSPMKMHQVVHRDDEGYGSEEGIYPPAKARTTDDWEAAYEQQHTSMERDRRGRDTWLSQTSMYANNVV